MLLHFDQIGQIDGHMGGQMSHIVPVLLCLEQQQVPLMPRDIVVSEPYLILSFLGTNL